MLYYGDELVKKAYTGGVEVSAMYIGSVKIYPTITETITGTDYTPWVYNHPTRTRTATPYEYDVYADGSQSEKRYGTPVTQTGTATATNNYGSWVYTTTTTTGSRTRTYSITYSYTDNNDPQSFTVNQADQTEAGTRSVVYGDWTYSVTVSAGSRTRPVTVRWTWSVGEAATKDVVDAPQTENGARSIINGAWVYTVNYTSGSRTRTITVRYTWTGTDAATRDVSDSPETQAGTRVVTNGAWDYTAVTTTSGVRTRINTATYTWSDDSRTATQAENETGTAGTATYKYSNTQQIRRTFVVWTWASDGETYTATADTSGVVDIIITSNPAISVTAAGGTYNIKTGSGSNLVLTLTWNGSNVQVVDNTTWNVIYADSNTAAIESLITLIASQQTIVVASRGAVAGAAISGDIYLQVSFAVGDLFLEAFNKSYNGAVSITIGANIITVNGIAVLNSLYRTDYYNSPPLSSSSVDMGKSLKPITKNTVDADKTFIVNNVQSGGDGKFGFVIWLPPLDNTSTFTGTFTSGATGSLTTAQINDINTAAASNTTTNYMRATVQDNIATATGSVAMPGGSYYIGSSWVTGVYQASGATGSERTTINYERHKESETLAYSITLTQSIIVMRCSTWGNSNALRYQRLYVSSVSSSTGLNCQTIPMKPVLYSTQMYGWCGIETYSVAQQKGASYVLRSQSESNPTTSSDYNSFMTPFTYTQYAVSTNDDSTYIHRILTTNSSQTGFINYNVASTSNIVGIANQSTSGNVNAVQYLMNGNNAIFWTKLRSSAIPDYSRTVSIKGTDI